MNKCRLSKYQMKTMPIEQISNRSKDILKFIPTKSSPSKRQLNELFKVVCLPLPTTSSMWEQLVQFYLNQKENYFLCSDLLNLRASAWETGADLEMKVGRFCLKLVQKVVMWTYVICQSFRFNESGLFLRPHIFHAHILYHKVLVSLQSSALSLVISRKKY